MIILSRYKDRPMIVVKSSRLQAGFLYEDGGKLVSLKRVDNDQELLATVEGEEYRVLEYDGSYVDSECSGFDDMFPTIDPYIPLEGPLEGKTYPDHGEICRMPMEPEVLRNSVTLRTRSELFHIAYQKTITPLRDGSIEIAYRISNQNAFDFPFVWAGHCMLAGVDGATVWTSYSDEVPRVQMFGPENVDPDSLPVDKLLGYQPEEGVAYKFYYLEPMPEGRFGLEYPDGSKLAFQVDPQKIPYLGIWFNNGEFKNMYNIALEPCSVPYDAPDRAAEHGYTSVIKAGETIAFSLRLTLES